MRFPLPSNGPYFKDCERKRSNKKQIIFYFKYCENQLPHTSRWSVQSLSEGDHFWYYS